MPSPNARLFSTSKTGNTPGGFGGTDLFGSSTGFPKPKTTVTPFGPILPTALNLPTVKESNAPWPIISLGGSRGFLHSVPSMYHPLVYGPTKVDKGVGTSEQMPEVIRKILSSESSSEAGLSAESSARPSSRPSNAAAAEFRDQKTAVHSPAITSLSLPNPQQPLTPQSDRHVKKREELERVQKFVEEARMAHEKIYANFNLDRANGRDPKLSASRRSLSASVTDANNVAELRRTLADKYQEVTPKAVKSGRSWRRRGGKYDREEEMVGEVGALEDLENHHPVNGKKISAHVEQVAPPKLGSRSPDRHISGVFVSYPRRRSISAPPIDPPLAESSESSPTVLASFRSGAKMSAAEFLALRQNLLNRSEAHAVSNRGV